MNTSQKWAVILWIAGLSSFALAQNTIKADQGRPGNQGPWPVTIVGSGGGSGSGGVVTGPDGGAVEVQSPCITVVEAVTSVGVAASNVPASTQADRKQVIVCNSPENTGTPILKCRADGTNPVIGVANAGQALSKGDCFTYNTTVGLKCIADTASTAASTSECK